MIEQNDWHLAYEHLAGEVLKTSVYDDFIIGKMGNVADRKILDYGCGPGVIAGAFSRVK